MVSVLIILALASEFSIEGVLLMSEINNIEPTTPPPPVNGNSEYKELLSK